MRHTDMLCYMPCGVCCSALSYAYVGKTQLVCACVCWLVPGPTVRCHWMPVDEILNSETALKGHRIWFLREAFKLLSIERKFIPLTDE